MHGGVFVFIWGGLNLFRVGFKIQNVFGWFKMCYSRLVSGYIISSWCSFISRWFRVLIHDC